MARAAPDQSVRLALLSLPVALLASLVLAPPAAALYEFDRTWGSSGSGNGQLNSPRGITIDPAGDVLVADSQNHRVQKFSPSGAFLGKWGSVGGSGDGEFVYSMGVATDSAGNSYVTDFGNHRIQKFSPSGVFITKWGGPAPGSNDGAFDGPVGVATDAAGNVYVADQNNHRIQKFSGTGTFLGKWSGEDSAGGHLTSPRGITTAASGQVIVGDTGNHRIQRFSSSGASLTRWGSLGSGDGQLNGPGGLATDSAGNVYVADILNHRIQKFTPSGVFITKLGSLGSDEGRFNAPEGIAIDSAGNVYVADSKNHRIQKFLAIPPQSTIDSGPSGLTEDPTPTFSFSSSIPGSTFECEIAGSGEGWKPCSSPHTTAELEDGLNVFRVRAKDPHWIVDPTPAEREFRVKRPPPPPPPSPPTADRAVEGSATAKKSQRQKGRRIVVKLTAKAGEALSARAAGKVALGRRSYKLGPKSAELAAGESKTLKLKPKRKADGRKIARALGRGKKAKAALVVKLSDRAGNSERVALAVRLRG